MAKYQTNRDPQTKSPQEVQGFGIDIPSPEGLSDKETSQLWRGGMKDQSAFWNKTVDPTYTPNNSVPSNCRDIVAFAMFIAVLSISIMNMERHGFFWGFDNLSTFQGLKSTDWESLQLLLWWLHQFWSCVKKIVHCPNQTVHTGKHASCW